MHPVDIQQTMARGNLDEIRGYAREMARLLGRPNGGFIPRWYTDPTGAGHTQAAIDGMCEEFLRVSGVSARPWGGCAATQGRDLRLVARISA